MSTEFVSSSAIAAATPVVVVNPASAGGKTGRTWPELEARIRDHLGDIEPRFTRSAGHATELTRDAIRAGARLVIAMGGDGTINEVVNGFFDEGARTPIAADAALGVLPMGTGGDFIKTTRTSKIIADAARAIAEATPRPIDVGRLEYVAHDGSHAVRHFVNIASFGIGGLVDRFVNRSSKILGGKASFFLASLRATVEYKNARVRLSLDDEPAIEKAIYSVAVANGRFFGGGMMIAPEAALDDAHFDVVTIGDVGMGTMLLHGTKIYSGKHVELPFVSVRRARKVVAEPTGDAAEVLLDVDGEAPGRLPATFELLPGAIRLKA